eukprot:COSAG01_NODE_1676_length_9521_cov_726.849926_3_plen_305_part_00
MDAEAARMLAEAGLEGLVAEFRAQEIDAMALRTMVSGAVGGCGRWPHCARRAASLRLRPGARPANILALPVQDDADLAEMQVPPSSIAGLLALVRGEPPPQQQQPTAMAPAPGWAGSGAGSAGQRGNGGEGSGWVEQLPVAGSSPATRTLPPDRRGPTARNRGSRAQAATTGAAGAPAPVAPAPRRPAAAEAPAPQLQRPRQRGDGGSQPAVELVLEQARGRGVEQLGRQLRSLEVLLSRPHAAADAAAAAAPLPASPPPPMPVPAPVLVAPVLPESAVHHLGVARLGEQLRGAPGVPNLSGPF